MKALEIDRGDDRRILFKVYEPDGTTLADVTESFLRFTAKRHQEDDQDDAIIEKLTDDGIDLGGLGEVFVKIDPVDTSSLKAPILLYFDLEEEDEAGEFVTLIGGRLKVKADVTTA